MLELKVRFTGVQTYCKGKKYKHFRVMSDNTTTMLCVNNEVAIKSEFCKEIEKELWMWCTSQDMWVSTARVPGTQNTETVNFSRNFNEAIEWKLSSHFFQKCQVCLETQHWTISSLAWIIKLISIFLRNQTPKPQQLILFNQMEHWMLSHFSFF